MSNILFIDVETSGYSKTNFEDRSNKYQFQIVSIGAIVADAKTWKERDRFYVEIQWNGESDWDPSAEKVHGLSKDYLREHGESEEQGFLQICEFILRHFDPAKHITLGGHNVSTFDRHFLIQLFDKYQATIQFSGRAVDTYTLGQVLFGCENSQELFEMLGIARTEHNALEDTQLALKAVRLSSSLFKQHVG